MSAATGGPSKKKQKVDHFAMNGTVGLSRLTKHTVGFTPELSPGALHSNRVAIQVGFQIKTEIYIECMHPISKIFSVQKV
jgi:hypothetical protein